MKKLLAFCAIFFFVGCATMKPDDYTPEGQESVTALNKSTGDQFVAADVAQLDANDAALQAELDTINALVGLHFGVGDGTYTDMSAISSTELGLLDGKTDLASADGEIYTGAHNFGDATSVEIPNGTDPDVDAAGEISADTDGANVANDFIIRAFDGTNQFPVASRNIAYQHTFNAAGAVTDDPVWYNDTGMTFNIEYIIVNCDSNTVTITLDEYTSFTNTTHLTEIDSLLVDSAGTGLYYTSACASGCTEAADIAHKVIETGHGVFAAYSGAGVGTILLRGYFDADVD